MNFYRAQLHSLKYDTERGCLGVCKGMMDFSQIQSIRTIKSTFCFAFDVITRRKVIHLAAVDNETRELWVEALQKLIGPAEVSGPMNAQRISAPRLSRLFESRDPKKIYEEDTIQDGNKFQSCSDDEKKEVFIDHTSETRSLLKDDSSNTKEGKSYLFFSEDECVINSPGFEHTHNLDIIRSTLPQDKQRLFATETTHATNFTPSNDGKETCIHYPTNLSNDSMGSKVSLRTAGSEEVSGYTSSEQNQCEKNVIIPEIYTKQIREETRYSSGCDKNRFKQPCDADVPDNLSLLVLTGDTPKSLSPTSSLPETTDSHAVEELKDFITSLGETQEVEESLLGNSTAINSMKSLLDDMNREENVNS
ncbi:uncharacterized protein LOC143235190 isoform X2 [Tachypleus tridentatus]|uniref:uncharacterized protein LOC143235190 isoform X2 n=1 Tax=Tachypleus tridentatus TaxID=6853 RepID=UPI003FD2FA56